MINVREAWRDGDGWVFCMVVMGWTETGRILPCGVLKHKEIIISKR